MNIGLVNFTPFVYNINTPYKKPLGGSESALCYLSEALAKRGHKITLFTRSAKKAVIRKVRHLSDKNLDNPKKLDLDFLIIQNTPYFGAELKSVLDKKTKLVFWSQHAADQPAVQCLIDNQYTNAFDVFVFISKWQMEEYLRIFPIDKRKCLILRNAVSPAFENLFPNDADILKSKTKETILAYTSTPFRGLSLLIKLFPHIKHRVPEARLKIYSSMSVYQTPKTDEEKDYGDLYRTCQKTKGVEYIGSIPQDKLAKELKKVHILSYPNIFPETSCISVMEAMATGCYVITSDLGALSETTAGFAKLISIGGQEKDYGKKFTNETVNILKKFKSNDNKKLYDHLIRQTTFVNNCYTWKKRACEWEMWLKEIV